jgi:ubiquinone/menaquinone biosynthesis C-methylase UbiE
MQTLTAVERWLSDEELGRIYTASYWNDIEQEKDKPWWIEDGDYERCRRYLDDSGLMLEYRQAEEFVRSMGGDGLKVVDLAAGIGWTSSLLSRVENVAEVHCVEISSHRLERLLPHSVVMYGGSAAKIRRYLGSFYDVKLPDHSMDVVFLSQAFHHADRPLRLLMECDRILKPGGRILVVGEHWLRPTWVMRRFLAMLFRKRRIVTDLHELFPPDPVLGDHYYRRSEYYLLFGAMGYRTRHRVAATGHMLYIADKSA